jgi:hypothetical protein
MKGLDVFVVRFLPFILFLIFGINLHCAYNFIDITITYNLHSNSFLYASALYFISLSNKKYHCTYNRAMYIFLIVVPIFNFLDECFVFFENFDYYIAFMYRLFSLTALITAYLAIKHFVQISKRRMTHGN